MDTPVTRLIAEYLASVPAKSRPAYKRVLGLWLKWCSDNRLNVLQIRRFHIDAYRVWRIERLGKQPATVASELVPICCFYEYLWQEQYIERNPAEHVNDVPHVF